MSGAHTKGPWSWCGEHDEYTSLQAEGGYILWPSYRVNDFGFSVTPYIDCENKADARLIAAAPELLEALEQIKCLAPPGTMFRADAEAAIAKAKGGDA